MDKIGHQQLIFSLFTSAGARALGRYIPSNLPSVSFVVFIFTAERKFGGVLGSVALPVFGSAWKIIPEQSLGGVLMTNQPPCTATQKDPSSRSQSQQTRHDDKDTPSGLALDIYMGLPSVSHGKWHHTHP